MHFRVGMMVGVVALSATSAFADYTVLGEQFDVSHVVRGTGTVSVACAAMERHLKTVKGKHFFGFQTPVDFAVEIPIGGEAVSFEASLGPARGSSSGAIVAKVLGDGRELWTSDAIPFNATNEIPVKVDMSGVKTLTLAVDSVGGTNGIAGLVWGEARLLCREGRVLPNDVRRTSRQLGILTPPERRSPRVNGPRVYGVRPGRPILFRVPVTGVGVKVKVNGESKGWTFDPETRILGGVIEKPGEYRLTITATNEYGRDEKPFVIKVGETLSLTPAMGWSSWNAFAGSVTEEDVRAAADALIATGLADHGYAYVNTDDFWQGEPGRDASGRLRPNERFPDMKGLVDAIHARGLKAGIYSSPGPRTCGGLVGSWRHEAEDAATFADWGFDYLKHDWCSYNEVATGEGRERAMRPYRVMGELLARQKRDIVLSLCQYGMENVSAWGREVGAQSWRTTGDVFDTWASVSAAIEKQKKLFRYTGPGAWNDPDMLCVGCVAWNDGKPCRLAPNEQYTHVSMWALVAAPLMIGCDLTKLDDFTRSLLANDEVIEIDQDPLGKGAGCIAEGDDWEIWARPLEDGSVAAGLYNKSSREQTIPFDLEAAGLLCKWRVRDVWRQEDVGVFLGTYEASVPGHATHLIRLFPLPCGHFRDGLSDIRENALRLLREDDLKSKRRISATP